MTRNLEIEPGQSISDLRVVVILGTGSIRGTVKFEGGDLPTDARIFIGVRREGTPGGGSGAPVDARGHFLINNLAPGTYEVTLYMVLAGPPQLSRRPFPPQKQMVDVVDDSEAQVTFTVDLKMKEGGP